MTENADENGGFRTRFQKWSRLKTHRFENAPYLVWIGKKGDFWKRAEKKRHTVVSFSVFGRFSVHNRRKRIKNMRQFSYENALVWRGENKPKTLGWAKIFCFVFVETKRDTSINALEWSEPNIPTKEIAL